MCLFRFVFFVVVRCSFCVDAVVLIVLFLLLFLSCRLFVGLILSLFVALMLLFVLRMCDFVVWC